MFFLPTRSHSPLSGQRASAVSLGPAPPLISSSSLHYFSCVAVRDLLLYACVYHCVGVTNTDEQAGVSGRSVVADPVDRTVVPRADSSASRPAYANQRDQDPTQNLPSKDDDRRTSLDTTAGSFVVEDFDDGDDSSDPGIDNGCKDSVTSSVGGESDDSPVVLQLPGNAARESDELLPSGAEMRSTESDLSCGTSAGRFSDDTEGDSLAKTTSEERSETGRVGPVGYNQNITNNDSYRIYKTWILVGGTNMSAILAICGMN